MFQLLYNPEQKAFHIENTLDPHADELNYGWKIIATDESREVLEKRSDILMEERSTSYQDKSEYLEESEYHY